MNEQNQQKITPMWRNAFFNVMVFLAGGLVTYIAGEFWIANSLRAEMKIFSSDLSNLEKTINVRFDGVDMRLDRIDLRLEGIDNRIAELIARIDAR